jgi:hypothetical protein
MFTSKLIVGADLQERVQRVYFHGAGYDGPSARTCWQMIMRARNTKDPTVRCYLGKTLGSASRPSDAHELQHKLQFIDQKRNDTSGVFNACAEKRWLQQHEAGEVKWSPADLMQTLAHDLVEQDGSRGPRFVHAFLQISAERGIGIQLPPARGAEAKQALPRHRNTEAVNRALAKLRAKDWESCKRWCEVLLTKSRRDGLGVDERTELEVLLIYTKFPGMNENKPTSATELAAMKKAIEPLERLFWTQSQDAERMKDKDFKALHGAPLPEMATYVTVRQRSMQTLLHEVLHTDQLEGFSVTHQDLATQEPRLKPLFAAIFRNEGGSTAGRTPKTLRGQLNKVLGLVGYRLRSDTHRKRQKCTGRREVVHKTYHSEQIPGIHKYKDCFYRFWTEA